MPALGLIFLAYADHRFEEFRPELEAKATARRPVTPDDYRAKSALYVPDQARMSRLVALPEGKNLGLAIDDAMTAVEGANPELRSVLPRGYQRLTDRHSQSHFVCSLRFHGCSRATRSDWSTKTSCVGVCPHRRARRPECAGHGDHRYHQRRAAHAVIEHGPPEGRIRSAGARVFLDNARIQSDRRWPNTHRGGFAGSRAPTGRMS